MLLNSRNSDVQVISSPRCPNHDKFLVLIDGAVVEALATGSLLLVPEVWHPLQWIEFLRVLVDLFAIVDLNLLVLHFFL